MSVHLDLAQIVDELSRAFPEYPRNALEGLVSRCAEQFAGATVQAFVPVLVRRAALEQLKYLEQGAAAQVVQLPTPTRSQASFAQ